jgi:hypothetical protein
LLQSLGESFLGSENGRIWGIPLPSTTTSQQRRTAVTEVRSVCCALCPTLLFYIFFSGWWRNHSYTFIFEMTLVINRVRHLASSCCWNCGVCDLPTSFDSRGLRRATKNPSRLDSEMAEGSCSKQGDRLSCLTWWIYTGQKKMVYRRIF